jgi:hypothetical protein
MDHIASRPSTSPSRATGVVLWQPEIAAPARLVAPARRVVIAEPAWRPEAVQAQVEASRSLLEPLAAAREALGAAAALPGRRAALGNERERVAAVIETYRVKTALEDALRGTLRRMSGFLEGRGLR